MNVDEVYKSKGIITMKIDKLGEFTREVGSRYGVAEKCGDTIKIAEKFSDPIYVRGLPWKIVALLRERRYGDGQRIKFLDYFLQCNAENQNPNWSCNASAILKVLAQKGGKEDLCREIKDTFNSKWNYRGFNEFISTGALMNPKNGWYDATTDSITLSAEINADIPIGIEIEIPSQVPENMGNLFDKRDQFFDCLLISSDEIEFKVYKGILACSSSVFAGMFQHGMVEAQNGIVRIEDIRSEVLELMLRFIYSGSKPNLEGKENIVGELLAAAEEYELIRLKVFCEHKLATSLNNENACELAALADLHSAKILKDNALKFIKENANEVIQTEGWKMLEQGIYGGELFNEIVKAINDVKVN